MFWVHFLIASGRSKLCLCHLFSWGSCLGTSLVGWTNEEIWFELTPLRFGSKAEERVFCEQIQFLSSKSPELLCYLRKSNVRLVRGLVCKCASHFRGCCSLSLCRRPCAVQLSIGLRQSHLFEARQSQDTSWTASLTSNHCFLVFCTVEQVLEFKMKLDQMAGENELLCLVWIKMRISLLKWTFSHVVVLFQFLTRFLI